MPATLHSQLLIPDNDRMGVGSTFKSIDKDQVHKIPVLITSIDKQDRFVELAEQSEKSK